MADAILTALTWLETSGLGRWVRDSGPWTYPLVNLAHVLGVALLFGSIAVLDLRLLGLWRRVPVAMLAEPAVPLAAAGLVLAVCSGVVLLSAQGSEYAGNPFLALKLSAVAAGCINAWLLGRSETWRAAKQGQPHEIQRRRLAAAGGLSLACWVTAISAGRLIGYV